ncbi:MAG: hypothetical protein KDD83_25315, partial [Caldilineaceae bacterium]|nr:hypothetical protein [Caldilineaceae bacterium]
VQALFPVASLHEMAGATFGGLAPHDIRTHLLDRLRAVPAYVDRFRDAFGTADEAPADAVTLSRLVEALAAFERRFIYTDAPWDRYLAGDDAALSDAQMQGALLFFGAVDPAINCAQCHGGDLFTDGVYRNILAPQLGPGKGNGYTGREDWGRAGVTFDARDRYAFRTPGLRNVTLTAPYLHSGAYATLEDTIRHHAAPVDAALAYDPSAFGVPPDLFSSLQPVDLARQLPTFAPELRDGLPLTDDDITALVAFLDALTDPAARDLAAFTPAAVPSGLALDPLPANKPLPVAGTTHVRAKAEPSTAAAVIAAPATAAAYFVDEAQATGLAF